MRLALMLLLIVPSILILSDWSLPALPAAHGAEWTPHPHKGVIKRLPFSGNLNLKLSAKAIKLVDRGSLWMETKEVKEIGTGVAVSDIAAPPAVVFDQVSDLNHYVGKVPLLKKLKIYETRKWGGTITQKAEYLVRPAPGFGYTYYVEHHANRDKRILLFFLDYDRKSDFDDLQGKWYVEAHPTKEGWSRVYYQCDLKLPGYIPKLIKTVLTKQGLSSAVGWVKKESEKVASSNARASVALSVPPGGTSADWFLEMFSGGTMSTHRLSTFSPTKDAGSSETTGKPRAQAAEKKITDAAGDQEGLPERGIDAVVGRRSDDGVVVATGLLFVAPKDWLLGACLVAVGMGIASFAAAHTTGPRSAARSLRPTEHPASIASGGLCDIEPDSLELPAATIPAVPM